MTLFKTAMRNFKKDPIMNIIAFVQLVAFFLVASVMISAISIRYVSYNAVKGFISQKGFYIVFDPMLGARDLSVDLLEGIFYSEDALNARVHADSVVSVQIAEAAGLIDYPITSGTAIPISFYDDELLSHCKPRLKSGRWIKQGSDKLEVVVTDNYVIDWRVGDTLALVVVQYPGERIIEAEIVGIVEGNSEIFGYHRPRDGSGDTFRYLFNTSNSNNINHPNRPTMISSSETLGRLFPDLKTRTDCAFFLFNDDTPDEEIKQKAMLAGSLNGMVIDDLDDLKENSKVYLRNELLMQMPVIVILLILAVVSAISVSAIATRRRLKDYAKYYVLGLQWKQCAVVNLLQALMTGVAALVISITALFVVSVTPLSKTITIIFNVGLVFSLLGVLALYLVFSMIMPLLMLRSTTPKALLQAE